MVYEVYEIIDEIEKSKLKKKLDIIKDKISNDKEAKELIKKFNIAKENYEKYNLKEEFLLAKKALFDNYLLNEYLSIQNEINILMLCINKRIKNITKD